ncbi:superoxide dismutase[Cu-Zn] [Nocardia seriolae]|uniref:superoxide dismutase[Cu-Zn] n=1 Tax=Nocardia seriolae TaxID=37332 RepID=UPI00051A0EB2|nr:superoxide dismutase family protein [Nocardia seriolae]MTJ60406.1 superoxide dismutase family protein [Nocardia seriolae]MTJ75462.1 superoxide dismutase family protein [Nocardia seriolae]MTJ84703.1 superoxide dismutase family protein [Nocardia seriolae]MTK28691.1 superoxide dismutase family protein [Nocardia seriolae]MTK38390.1 superoxide dismutase family protein [Nocardia seriolae]
MASSSTRRPSWWTVAPVLAVAALGLTACSNGQESSDVKGTTPPVFTSSAAPAGAKTGLGSAAEPRDSVSATLKDSNGQSVGTATFTSKGGHLEVIVEAHGLKPGFHGLHLHQNGKCEGDFTSAGGHLQVGEANAHPSSGDLTSLQVLKDGTATLTTTTDSVTLDEIKGKALIVHAGADNFGNIPTRYAAAPDADTLATGDAGARVACGVVA